MADAARMQSLIPHLLPIAAVFCLAGLVKGIAGTGLPTVAMGLLGLWLAPPEAAALLVLPSLLTNLQQAWGDGAVALLRRLWPLLATLVIGTWLSAGILVGADPALARGGLGGLLALYALLGLSRWQGRLPQRHEPWAGPAAGLATGLLTGATGVFVVPALPYLVALDLSRETLMRALGYCFFTATLTLAIALAWHGAFTRGAVGPSLLALLPTALGMWLGTRLRQRIPAEAFRRVFFLTLLALGVHQLWQALG
ncbi:sulfite exporter TauE/SafE family protein [Xanthomonas translucens pv. hordei]|nr:sulfite exporter TauE/SafE family protein [Xanthomonas translucens pv. translucens]QSQ38203.1 sulfite exporter TauE/SafE family protein [Xanthomonas translucens pv. translucens]UKE57609.1 sulfite exporter TauE/SafE family protein [Xanthomonas translucens pv. hordei]WIH00619.1 sulfite exporter TauE/SafE family protein [Xanthomonas translucens pv. hordei]